jgi:GT2 family glycosyltransferase
MSTPAFSIVVSNWEGEAWLARTLSSLQLSGRRTGLEFETLVVDDASSDGSVALVRDRFPGVRLLVNEHNVGFGESTMRGARAARGRVLVLCNNDLVPKEEFLPNLLRWFQSDPVRLPDGSRVARARLFGVAARTLSWFDGTPNQLCMGAVWQGGRLTPAWSAPESTCRCLFVQAGAAAYDRDAFLRLGGLDGVFAPGYWEDYDLSYRAAKEGLVALYDPEALALHHGGGSMQRRFGAGRVARLKARNHLLFEWMNLSDPWLLAAYCGRLAVSLGREWLSGRPPALTWALLDALCLLRPALRGRLDRRHIVGDAELLRTFGAGTPSY